jgi:minor extracellular serine protease Vpr
MKTRISLLVFCLISHFVFGQGKLTAKDRHEIEELKSSLILNGGSPSSNLLERLPIQKINGNYYLSLLGKINSNFEQSCLIEKKWLTGKAIGQVASVKVPLSDLASIESTNEFDYLEIASKIRNQLDKAVVDMHADSVQQGINLPEGYTGKDVYIGITDWGFDYTSPMFYDTSLQQTRILAAWDQFKLSGPSPNGFNYGTEYSTPAELFAAGSDTSNIYSYATHGTHVAGIAGGSGAGTIYRGVAFDSKFLFVTFLVDENAVLDAWEWMYQKANADGKRLVINMSWGLYHFGTLDGTSLLSQAISAYTDLGVVFTNSGGNNGNVNFHLKKTFNSDVLKSKIDFYSYSANPNMWGQSVHAWGEVGKSFSNGIIITNSTGSILAESPYYSTNSTPTYIDTFLLAGQDTIWYNITADSAHPLNNKPQMRLRVKNLNSALRVLLKSTADSGTVNYWNVTELSNDVGNWGMNFSASGTGTVTGDNQNGISEPSCSDDVISVAAYSAQYTTPAGNLTGGAAASFSSNGPRYDGVMKPDIAAPGVNVVSSMSSFTDAVFTSTASIDFNGKTYHFAKLSGTSMASPMVAGVSALILDANPYLSARQVKEIIMETARQDNYTGVIPAEGSPKWGAGKINAYAAVKLALQTVGMENPPQELMWSVYPNPVMNELHFTIVEELPKTISIFDISGSYYEKPIINGKVYVSDLPAGQYFIRILIDGKVQQDKFIKQ